MIVLQSSGIRVSRIPCAEPCEQIRVFAQGLRNENARLSPSSQVYSVEGADAVI